MQAFRNAEIGVEDLEKHGGFTGKRLREVEGEILLLRGEVFKDHPYFGNLETIGDILKTALMPEEEMGDHEKMQAKLLEVMGVSKEELKLMEEYLQDRKSAASMLRESDDLKREAKKKMREAQKKVEDRYPRKSQKE